MFLEGGLGCNYFGFYFFSKIIFVFLIVRHYLNLLFIGKTSRPELFNLSSRLIFPLNVVIQNVVSFRLLRMVFLSY